MSSIQLKSLWMEADISVCRSQQSIAVIWTVTRESQHANHAVMEIRMIRAIGFDSQGICILRTKRKEN